MWVISFIYYFYSFRFLYTILHSEKETKLANIQKNALFICVVSFHFHSFYFLMHALEILFRALHNLFGRLYCFVIIGVSFLFFCSIQNQTEPPKKEQKKATIYARHFYCKLPTTLNSKIECNAENVEMLLLLLLIGNSFF